MSPPLGHIFQILSQPVFALTFIAVDQTHDLQHYSTDVVNDC